ncbi:MAG: TIGR03936 family radical SAM-associated protein [Thermodesulfovibrio sp.]|nr:TIGR03936 family radical SAM-associated protein [Thermodesulfovibrio sp.]MDW7998039.1 TIGR03936 family radical SAM-associated protein [Thermodesulfovibrio sp.]
MNLLFFEKPTRYINSEINSLVKKDKELIKFCLCFPDIYEIGMSNLGLKIIYHVLNKISDVHAERLFSPWIDFQEYLKKNNLPLTSLETKMPVKDFDILGFSLQSELSYSSVLNILSLAHIPLSWEERLNKKYPLIIAGGPCTSNPLPMSHFIDAFLIGEGEEAVVELINTYREWKIHHSSKEELLNAVNQIEGFYVPYAGKKIVRRRYVDNLNNVEFPTAPVLPYVKIVHDRVSIEVSRGCPSGCRFCQAGMIYRPLRMRNPEKILEIAKKSIKNTGYEELSLLSFSIGHYPYLMELIDALNKSFSEQGIAISLPSIRADKVTKELLQKIKFTRKTGFTIAPEAATERLRCIINKNISNEDIEKACAFLFEEGWLSIKLYFMIGLPSETDEDVEEIINLSKRIIKLAKNYTKKFVDINVTVSPFIPKPHTPFQWFGQIPFEEMREKLDFIKKSFHRSKIYYKGHVPEMSILEASISRGDEKVGEVIFRAWQKGEVLSAWTDLFDFKRWLSAMDETGVDLFSYATKQYSTDEPLPWAFIDSGIKREFLIRELERALTINKTNECNINCEGCGLGCQLKDRQTLLKDKRKFENLDFKKEVSPDTKITVVRFCHTKLGIMKYLSQLELSSLITRALRMAEIPFVLSKGFHPKPEISFCPSLPVGVESEKEYFDLKIYGEFREEYIERLNKVLPAGIRITNAKTIPQNSPSLNSFIKMYKYIIEIDEEFFLNQDSIENMTIQRDGKTFFLKEFLVEIQINDKEVCIIVKDGQQKARISEIVNILFGKQLKELKIKRIAMYGLEGGLIEP